MMNPLLLLAGLAAALPLLAADGPTNVPVAPPATNAIVPDLLATNTAATNAASVVVSTNAASINPVSTNAVAVTNAVAAEPPDTTPAPAAMNYAPGEGLRMNFRGAPLELVLNYLSEAAGFVIVLDSEVRGKIDAWSSQPLTKDEAVNLLNSSLNKNGYTAIRNGRVLTIVARDSAKTRDIPVISGSDPAGIPKTEDIVTQIIPVRYINAVQLTKDLQPLLPSQTTMTANEGGNALVITDTQINIRRMAEIVRALDTAIATVSAVRVFPLKFADAKAVATVIKDVFQSQDSGQRSGDLRSQFMSRFRGGPFGGMMGGDAGGASGGGNGRQSPPKVVATSDDHSNSLIVSAPEDMMPTIEELVKAVDTDVEDVTEVRVFKLTYADPVEMSDLLMQLFPDDTRTDASQSAVRFGGAFGGRSSGRGTTGTASQSSERQKRKGRVIAVPDQRTASVVVSAAKELMDQIGQMVMQLDANPAKKQKVYVYSLENADVQQVEQILRNMFDKNGTLNSRNTSTRNNPLTTRSTQTQQSSGTSLGTSGSGSSRSQGSLGGGGF